MGNHLNSFNIFIFYFSCLNDLLQTYVFSSFIFLIQTIFKNFIQDINHRHIFEKFKCFSINSSLVWYPDFLNFLKTFSKSVNQRKENIKQMQLSFFFQDSLRSLLLYIIFFFFYQNINTCLQNKNFLNILLSDSPRAWSSHVSRFWPLCLIGVMTLACFTVCVCEDEKLHLCLRFFALMEWLTLSFLNICDWFLKYFLPISKWFGF